MDFTKEELGKEIWKDCVGYEGLYQVSDLGRVRSIKNNKFLKGGFCNMGYHHVSLCKKGKCTTTSIHRLVMLTFKGKSELQVDHINRVKNDNRVINLRYCTPRENTSFATSPAHTSSFIGVHFDKYKNKWISSIRIKKQGFNLGSFDREIDARDTYLKALYEWENLGVKPFNPRGLLILNLNTGVFYYSITEARIAYNLKNDMQLYYMLTKRTKNKTDLIIV